MFASTKGFLLKFPDVNAHTCTLIVYVLPVPPEEIGTWGLLIFIKFDG